MPRPRKTVTTNASPLNDGASTEKKVNPTAMLSVPKLTETEKPRLRSVGRPAKLVAPPMPKMPMEPAEQDLFDFFMDAFKDQYPDLTPTDLLLLYLAGIEFIKYMRVAAEELATGKVISMARQHPGTQMRSLLDSLSVTRKARLAKGKAEDEDGNELRDFFMGKARG